MALLDDLQKPVTSIDEFRLLTERILRYIPEVITSTRQDKGYIIIESVAGSTRKFARPYNSKLFITAPDVFTKKFELFRDILGRADAGDQDFAESDFLLVDMVTYTIQQSFGIALDLLGNQNANRKHVGNRFEELMSQLVQLTGITNKKIVLKIPYEENGIYSCETDFVFSPYNSVRSNNETIDKKEIVVSLKTSSKDRMGKIFIDKILMSRFVGRDVKVIGIFLNDIQRKEQEKVGYTFVAGLFMVYTNFLVKLDGVYFVDPPPNAQKEPYSNHIKRFSRFLLSDAKKLLDVTP